MVKSIYATTPQSPLDFFEWKVGRGNDCKGIFVHPSIMVANASTT